MREPLGLAVIARIKARVRAFVTDYRKRLKSCHFYPLTQWCLYVLARDLGTVPESHGNWLGDLNGDRHPQEIIGKVDGGYYLVGHGIPSISESRENFRITARKVYTIEPGKLTKLYRSGGMSADSRDYLMSIDAVGNDFKLIPVPDCGEGQPMQSMSVGNGGPTMRGRAKVLGGDVVGEDA
jgi:hypothetical protein